MSTDLEKLRAELLALKAQVKADLGTMSRQMARRLARERRQLDRELQARLSSAALTGLSSPTAVGTHPEPVPSVTPLIDRLRSDYAIPAGTLDRLALNTVGQLDENNALELFFQLPGTTYDVYECYVGAAFRQFYATATGAASGGGSSPTSGASSSSSSGSSSSSSSGASSSSSSGASSNTSSGASSSSSSSNNAASSSSSTTGNNAASSSSSTTNSSNPSHDHSWAAWVSNTPGSFSNKRFGPTGSGSDFNIETSSSGVLRTGTNSAQTHSHGMSHTHSHSHGMSHTHSHSHNIDHTHTISHHHNIDHTHGISHTHNIDHTHTVTVSAHTHDLAFGIYKESMPASWSVTPRLYEWVTSAWVLRYTGTAITTLVGEVDLSAEVTGAGMWLVTFQSDAAQPNGGRLSAQLYGTVIGAVRAE